MKFKVLVFCLIYVLFSFVFICSVYAAPTDEQIKQAAGTLGVPFADLKRFVQSYQPKTEAAGTIKVEARKLYEDYKANQLKADGLYLGKTLQVSGRVVKINKTIMTDEYYLEIAGSSSLGTVDVYFNSSELDKIADLNSGQTITVVGECEGYSILSVKITNAYLVSGG